MGLRFIITTVVLSLAAMALAPAAQATFPGGNGKIAFARSGDIWTMNPDGTGGANLTSSADSERNPAWPPDGKRIAFDSNDGSGTRVYVMFSDGAIEAETPNGSFRFSSLDELKAFIAAEGAARAP